MKIGIETQKLTFEEEIQLLLDGRCSSEEELQMKLNALMERKNNDGIEQFFGLSPNDMQKVLYVPFSLSNTLFVFKPDEECLKEHPFLKEVLFFLKKLKDLGELKGTQLGNLPRNFVQEFYHLFHSQEGHGLIPYREEDLYQLSRLKTVLMECKVIKKRNNKFSLTQKGLKVLEANSQTELFSELVTSWARSYNWAHDDRMNQILFIQQSAVFNFYLLHKMAQDWVLDEELGNAYLNAFPFLAEEVKSSFWGPKKEIRSAFVLRFLERFCLPLGFVEKREEGDWEKRKTFYRVKPFFQHSFLFRSV